MSQRLVQRFVLTSLLLFSQFGITDSFFQGLPSPRMSLAHSVASSRDADFIEMMVGGERYSMIPLPDSLMDTTLFVGNLCELVNDDHLSSLFQAASHLQSVPAIVARKANMNSLGYGFVTFPTVAEKEAAIIRFHGHELNGRKIRVEPIEDKPNCNRVKVPEKLVAYTCGVSKKTRDGKEGALRRSSKENVAGKQRNNGKKKRERSNTARESSAFRLNAAEQKEMERAAERGFVTLDGTGFGRGRKGSQLACCHRQWCDDREKPHVILCKASGGRPLDYVIVDLSPLRINSLFEDPNDADDFLLRWKTEILLAASTNQMELRDDTIESALIEIVSEGTDDDEMSEEDVDECLLLPGLCEKTEFTINVDSEMWTREPISKLPPVSIGVFQGQRSDAKKMVRQLSELWDIPDPESAPTSMMAECQPNRKEKKKRDEASSNKNRGKKKTIREERRRNRNEIRQMTSDFF